MYNINIYNIYYSWFPYTSGITFLLLLYSFLLSFYMLPPPPSASQLFFPNYLFFYTTFLFKSTPLSKLIFVIEIFKQLSISGNCGLFFTSLLHMSGIIFCINRGICVGTLGRIPSTFERNERKVNDIEKWFMCQRSVKRRNSIGQSKLKISYHHLSCYLFWERNERKSKRYIKKMMLSKGLSKGENTIEQSRLLKIFLRPRIPLYGLSMHTSSHITIENE